MEMFRVMGSKMMIFQNNRVWERWVVVLCNRCCLRKEILKERCRSMEMFRDMGSKIMIFQNNRV